MRFGTTGRLIASNSAWGIAQQGAIILGGLATTVILARVLTTDAFGAYQSAVAGTTIGYAIMTAGLSGLAVRELKRSATPQRAATSILLVRELCGVISVAILLLWAMFTSEQAVTIAVLVTTPSVLLRAADVPELWYSAALKTQRSAQIRVATTLTFVGLRVVLLTTNPSLLLACLLFTAEAAVGTLALNLRYILEGQAPGYGRPSLQEGFSLLRSSFPLALSGVAQQVTQRGDLILVQILLGLGAAGLYAAAARLAEFALMLPVIFMNALFPVLLDLQRESPAQYDRLFRRAYVYAWWSGVMLTVALWVGAPLWVAVVFGDGFEASVPILRVYSLAIPFLFLAAVFSKWLIAENLLWWSVTRHSVSALITLITIPSVSAAYGVIGVAWVSVTCAVVSSYLLCFTSATTRHPALQMTRAMVAPFLFRSSSKGK